MTDPRFLQPTLDGKIFHAAEECGELAEKLGLLVSAVGDLNAALMKSARWGIHSVNPLPPKEEQETNQDWILRSMTKVREAMSGLIEEEGDLIQTMNRLKAHLLKEPFQ